MYVYTGYGDSRGPISHLTAQNSTFSILGSFSRILAEYVKILTALHW